MIRVTAVWTDWVYDQRSRAFKEQTIHPTPGRDRPLVVDCSSPFTAGVMAGIFKRLGCNVEQEEIT